MSAPYICPSCRRNAVQHTGALRRLSRTSKATFISFRSNNPRQSPAKEPASASNAEPSTDLRQSQKRAPQHADPSRAGALSSLFGVIGTSDRYSRPHTAGQALDKPPQSPRAPQPKASQTVPAASELQKILDDEAKPDKEAWEYFQRHYTGPTCPALKSPSLLDVHALVSGLPFRRLQHNFVHAWCGGRLDPSLPSPVEVVQRYLHLGLMKPENWHIVLWGLNVNALTKYDATGERPGPSTAEIMAQVMRVWDLLLKASSSEPAAKEPQSSTGVESSTPMWSSLRLPWNTVRQMTRPHRFFGTRLNQFLPAIDVYKSNRISYSALVTFDILTRDDVESVLDEKLLTESRPFVVFLAHLIPGSTRLPLRPDDKSPNEMANLLERSHVSSTDVAALLSRIKDSTDKCMPIIASVGRSLDAGRDNRFDSSADVDGENRDSEGILGIDGEVKSKEEGLANFYYGRIGRAYSEYKRLIIYDLWLEAYQALSRRNPTDPPVPPKLYDLALEALMASRLPEQAIDVWNKMIENGIKPTIKTWTAMIDGCGKARDTEGMEQIWVRMLNSGVQPDVYAWSARVSGMMRAGRLRQGFAVLDEMAKIWTLAHKRAQSAAKKRKTKVDTAELPAKPNIVVLNGAITALASRPPRRNENFLGPVLEWAKSLSIQPDIITYNSLISLSLRSGNTEEAMNLLQRMERVNVQPDVATFSIILNSIFRSGAPTKLSQEEQHEKVMAVLGNLETHGIEVTGHIFGTLIDGLLKRHDNEVAARAVLAHMVAKGLQVPPHIYTSLMTHYFERHDLAAVDALWAQIEASGTVLDIVFFDRMIEQYARIHDVDRMMVFLKRMSNRGLAPGWPALQDVVVKLAEIGDWERFDQIVNDVEQGVGVARKGMRVSPDNVIHQFWKAVARKRALKPKPEPYQEIFPHAQQEKL